MSSLALLQLVSPALPVGGFSYSEGLEVLIQSETIRDEQQLQAWLEAELSWGAIRLEAAALPSLLRALAAWSAGETAACRRVLDLDGWLLASRESAELRAQQRQMGGAFALNLKKSSTELKSSGKSELLIISSNVLSFLFTLFANRFNII